MAAADSQLPATLKTVTERTKWLVSPIETGIKANLERTGIHPGRFAAVVSAAFAKTAKLYSCDLTSIRSALLACSSDGLVPDGKRAALVPFYDTREKKLLCQYIPMVQGIMSRMRDLSDIFTMTAEVVYKTDTFEYDRSNPYVTTHKDGGTTEERIDVNIVMAYAIFRDRDGRVIHREIMDRRDLDKARSASRAENSPAWRGWYSEMARKTVVRRGSKYVPMSEALRTIIERDDEYVKPEAIGAPIHTAVPIGYDPLAQDLPSVDSQDAEEDATQAKQIDAEVIETNETEPTATDDSSASVIEEYRVALDGATTKAEIMKIRTHFSKDISGLDKTIQKLADRMIGQRLDAIATKGKK